VILFKAKFYYAKDGTCFQRDPPTPEPDAPPIKIPPAKFNQGPQIKETLKNHDTSLDFFNYFFDNNLIEKIVKYTNERIEEDFDKLTVCELRAFIGVLILLGVTKKNDVEISEIWSYESSHHLWLATAPMGRDRYNFGFII